MNIRIHPRSLFGTIAAPASKSEAHRLLICAAFSDKQTIIHLNASSEDIEATMGCLKAMGAGIERRDEEIEITPIHVADIPDNPLLDCHESGSTLRFFLPVAATLCDHAAFTGSGRLPDRPIGELLDEMERHGVSFTSNKLPLETRGRLHPGEYQISGSISSQYITGLLLALPLAGTSASCVSLDGDSRLTLTSPLQSAAYVDITLDALSRFGVHPRVRRDARGCPAGYDIPVSPFSSPGRLNVSGDWSNAAFFLAAGALCRPVSVTGLDMNSPQGDRKILELLRSFGAEVDVQDDTITVSPAPLRGQEIDIDPTPDLLPILSAVACCADGITTFFNAARLRLKESDRLAATAAMICSLGGNVQKLSDKLIVQGSPLAGGTVDGCRDHRMVMAASIAALRCSGEVTVMGAEAIDKSYPNFFKDYRTLGGEIHVL